MRVLYSRRIFFLIPDLQPVYPEVEQSRLDPQHPERRTSLSSHTAACWSRAVSLSPPPRPTHLFAPSPSRSRRMRRRPRAPRRRPPLAGPNRPRFPRPLIPKLPGRPDRARRHAARGFPLAFSACIPPLSARPRAAAQRSARMFDDNSAWLCRVGGKHVFRCLRKTTIFFCRLNWGCLREVGAFWEHGVLWHQW